MRYGIIVEGVRVYVRVRVSVRCVSGSRRFGSLGAWFGL